MYKSENVFGCVLLNQAVTAEPLQMKFDTQHDLIYKSENVCEFLLLINAATGKPIQIKFSVHKCLSWINTYDKLYLGIFNNYYEYHFMFVRQLHHKGWSELDENI